MKLEGQLEDRLRDALRRPEGSTWPDEHGAFDRFLRRRARHGRTLAAGAVLALVGVLAAAVLLQSLLPDRSTGPITRPVPAGRVARVPAGGFEVPLPAGWTARKVDLSGPTFQEAAIIQLAPQRATPGMSIVLQTLVLAPEQHPGLPPGEEPGGVADTEGSFYMLDDRGSPLGRGRRPDGRPYVWRTRKLPDEVGEYAIAWPYHCHKAVACPRGNRWRVLVVHAGRSDNPAVMQELREVAQEVVDTVRPITNALPGGDPAHLDPALAPGRPEATAVPVPTTSGPRP